MTGIRGIAAAAFALVAGSALWGSYYTVDSTQMANVRRFGDPLYATPVGPGLHFKRPFIDDVDKLQVSQTFVTIPPFKVTTVDNQEVTLDISFNFTIPRTSVNHLMYEVGRAGNADIDDGIAKVAQGEAGRVFAHQNMIVVNQNRDAIQVDLEKSIFDALKAQFGIAPIGLQLSIHPSDAFMKSNEEAIRTKNETIAAQNTENTRRAQANQQVITARGEADSAIEAARGRAEAQVLEAKANKQRLELEGQGEEGRLEAEIKAFGSPQLYVEYLKARAQLKWDGRQPQIVTGNGTATNLVVPLPAPR